VVNATPRQLFTLGKDPVPVVEEVGWGLRAGLEECTKSRLPPGFDPRTAQPVASRFTDCSIPATYQILIRAIKLKKVKGLAWDPYKGQEEGV